MKANNFSLLVDKLKDKGWTLGSCESCTGGLFAAEITEVPGVSSLFKGAVVTYWTQIKLDVVHVEEQIVRQYGVISEQTARQMADRCAELLQCDVCVSFTGNAGPGVMEEKPAGTVMMGIHLPDRTITYQQCFVGDRHQVRQSAVQWMAQQLIQEIEK